MSAVQRPIYAKIPLEKRQKLIKMVIQEHMSIAKAGRQLALKPSTAKLIVRKYRETGRFFMKRNLNTQPQQIQGENQSPYTNSVNFTDGTYIMKQQQNMLMQSNVDWSCNLGLNVPDSNYYLVYPYDYTNFIVYF